MAITINHQTNDISATSGSLTIDGSAVGGGTPLGDGQSWQSVSRSSGTWYQNTTGRTIVFMCGLRGDYDGTFPIMFFGTSYVEPTQSLSNPISAPQIFVDDLPSYSPNNSLYVVSIVPITLIVPSGYYYRVNQQYGSLNSPRELR